MGPPKRERGPLDRPASRNSSSTTDQSDRPKGTAGDRQLAAYEATCRLEAVSTVLAADVLDHGSVDGDTAAWTITMVDTAARWIAQVAA